ncbi:MAG: dTDP-4-dehydrorhamnose 3,5-epimerase [Chloroflexota bacterium]
MIFTKTALQDAVIVDIQAHADERGFFGRTWCQEEFAAQGLDPNLAQCSISYNRQKGTLRGMHLQLPPFAEAKLVRCVQGAIYDVIIDLRTDSPSYMQWIGVELTAVNHRALYVPKGFAHGFLSLADDTEVLYMISEFYAPDQARGLRWNDPQFNIQWPGTVTVMSDKDQVYPDYNPADFPLTVA